MYADSYKRALMIVCTSIATKLIHCYIKHGKYLPCNPHVDMPYKIQKQAHDEQVSMHVLELGIRIYPIHSKQT